MKSKIKIVLVLMLILSFKNLNGQNQKKIDSITNIINTSTIDSIKATNHLTLADLMMYTNPKVVKKHIDSADSLYQKSPNDRGIANLYALKANYLYTQSAYDSSMVYLGKAGEQYTKIGDTLKGAITKSNLAILVKLISGDYDKLETIVNDIEPIANHYKDSSLIATMLAYRADIAANKGFRNIAIKKTKEAINIRESIGDSVRLPQEYYKMGQLYLDLFDYKNAISSFDEGITIEDALGNKSIKAQLLRLKAASQIEIKQYDQAEKNLNEALELSKEINLKTSVIQTLIQFSNLELEHNNYNKANSYLNQVKSMMASVNPYGVDYNYNLFKGKTNLASKNYSAALENFKTCVELAEQKGSLVNLSFSKKFQSEALEKMGNYKEALTRYKESSDAKDTLTSQLRTTLSMEQKIIYETEKKEHEIALKTNQIKLMEEREQKASAKRWFIIITLLGIIAFAISVIYGLRQKMKRNKLEHEQLNASLRFKEKELTTHALHLAHKNEVLLDLKEQVKKLKKESSNSKQFQGIINSINLDINNDSNWKQFKSYFEDVHKDFNAKVMKQFPEVSTNDLRLMALLKMNLSTKEIASILNISVEGVKKARYRLRKKLNLNTEESLQEMVLEM